MQHYFIIYHKNHQYSGVPAAAVAMATKALPAVQRPSPSCMCHHRLSASCRPHHNSYRLISGHATAWTYYKICGCLQERMYLKHICDVDDLKQRLVEVSPKSDHTSIRCFFGSSTSCRCLWYTHSTGFRLGLLGGQRSGDVNFSVWPSWCRYSVVTDAWWAIGCTAGSALVAMATAASGTLLC